MSPPPISGTLAFSRRRSGAWQGPRVEPEVFDGDVQAAFDRVHRRLRRARLPDFLTEIDDLRALVTRRTVWLESQSLWVADANARAVEILAQQKELAEELRIQNLELAVQNRALQQQRREMDAQMAAVADANVDAVLLAEEKDEKLRKIGSAHERLVETNRELSKRARVLEEESLALASSNAEAVTMLANQETQLAYVMRENSTIEQERAELERRAYVDELTGLPNHRSFKQRIATEFARARRYGRELSILFIDVDHFKRINDQLGHQTGDAVLHGIAQVLDGELRSSDTSLRVHEHPTAARYGGEEFVVLLPETGAVGALVAAERLRARVESTELPGVQALPGGRCTVSVGVASLSSRDDAADGLIRRADEALYAAKRGGRNQVVVAD